MPKEEMDAFNFYNSFNELNESPNIVPTAPTSSVKPFQLSRTSFDFDFPISQIASRDTDQFSSEFQLRSGSRTINQMSVSSNRADFNATDFTYKEPYNERNSEIMYVSPKKKRMLHPISIFTPYSSDGRKKRTKPEVFTPSALKVYGKTQQDSFSLRSVEEIRLFQHIFPFPYFNILQSTVFDAVLYTDKSVVVSAPTGSGKTAVFEMALVRLLIKIEEVEKAKIIYMAPMKALCTERFQDWTKKLLRHGLVCLELTGDSELDDLAKLHNVNLICTTPEKWDSMSRRWKDKKTFFQDICLFLVDEIHTLNDATRGATIEAVISRMKTLNTVSNSAIRFIAVSATLPNYLDIAEWLETPAKPAVAFNIEEKHRPVRLERFVIGYPFKEGSSDFRFDMNLSYKLRGVIEAHCHGKPTLVFCSSRKSVIQTAEVLAKDMHHILCNRQVDYDVLCKTAMRIHEPKVKDFLLVGIGIHHAGLLVEDRCTVEDLFRLSQLPVLISTSTLAMGVNLPAHLVIIKSTHFYNMGSVLEYSDMQILQMIGRAGRPQFDTSASAVIMTKAKLKSHYQALVGGTQLIESSLHKNLIEHLNAEIVLQTLNDMALAVEWMRHTFLYVRVIKNAKHYGLPEGLTKEQVEKRLQDLCLRNLNLLTSLDLVYVQEETYEIFPTETGRLMARYCIAFETMKLFHSIDPKQDSIEDMLSVVSQCAEFEEIQLRTNEKRILNMLNKDKMRETIRFPLPGKIKTKQMKVNCLLQAQLSNLPIQDFSLSQDVAKIFRVGQRVTKCLMELLYQGQNYNLLLHATMIFKALKTKLWYDSRYVSRQLEGIGMAMSLNLVNSGLYSFQKLQEANPREIEAIVNRHPPFGNQIKEAISCLPRYELFLDQLHKYSHDRATLVLKIDLTNRDKLQENSSMNKWHQSLLIIGDEDNAIVFKWRINDLTLLQEGAWSRAIEIKRARSGNNLNISLLSLEWVGLDIVTKYEPLYASGWENIATSPTPSSKLKTAMDKSKIKDQSSQVKKADMKRKASEAHSCNHSCLDKIRCGHQCCKTGRQGKQTQRNACRPTTPRANAEQIIIEPCMSIKPSVDSLFHLQPGNKKQSPLKQARITLKKFAYVKPKQLQGSLQDSEEKQGFQNFASREVPIPLTSAGSTTSATTARDTLSATPGGNLPHKSKMQEGLSFLSLQAGTSRLVHRNSIKNDIDDFIATKSYSANEQLDTIEDMSSVHSSDEDLCRASIDLAYNRNVYVLDAQDQIVNHDQERDNIPIDLTNGRRQNSPKRALDLSLSASSRLSSINSSNHGQHNMINCTVNESPETISICSSISQEFPIQCPLENHGNSDSLTSKYNGRGKSSTVGRFSPGAAKSPHRYGLVHAWPRSKNFDSSNESSSNCGKISQGSDLQLQSSPNYPLTEVNTESSETKMSSIFVPHNEVPISETYIPGKLFDGIFDELY